MTNFLEKEVKASFEALENISVMNLGSEKIKCKNRARNLKIRR